MTRIAILFLTTTTLLAVSCNTSTSNVNATQTHKDSTSTAKDVTPEYKAIKYIDSFINTHGDDIKKSNALKEHNEGLCTKQMLPLIDKKGLYNDIPFKLVTTTTHNGLAYGNFIYEDDRHFVKVTCIIKEKQLQNLQENNQYFIKFKTAKFEDGVSFENEFSKIELPTVNAYLTSFTPYGK
ncbi:MAG TPA: hypothetical protein VIL78_16740 [Hanamia sp.]